MRTILTMMARPEKFLLRSNELCRKDNSRFAISITQIWILVAFALSQ